MRVMTIQVDESMLAELEELPTIEPIRGKLYRELPDVEDQRRYWRKLNTKATKVHK